MHEPSLEQYRYFLKEAIRQEVDFTVTDENLKVPPPPLEKPFPADAARHDLPPVGEWAAGSMKFEGGAVNLVTALGNRRSHRDFNGESLTLDELSFLLWATQGVRQRGASGVVFRTVPSSGDRHPLETYLALQRVSGLEPGIYRYLPLEHQLLHLFEEKQMAGKLLEAAAGQWFVVRAAAVFIWTTIPYRANGATGWPPTRPLPWTPDTSARTCIWPVRRLGRGPAPWLPTTRKLRTALCGWTARRNSSFIWPRWARFSVIWVEPQRRSMGKLHGLADQDPFQPPPVHGHDFQRQSLPGSRFTRCRNAP